MRRNPRYSGPPIQLPSGLYWLGLGLGALTFLGGLGVNLFAIGGVNLAERVPGVLLLHLTAMASAAIYIIGAARGGDAPDDVPRWVKLIMGALLLNALLGFFQLPAGTPTEVAPGQYELLSHGEFVRQLTREEYLRMQAAIPRAFSGFWMLFAGAATLGCAWVLRMRNKQIDGGIRR